MRLRSVEKLYTQKLPRIASSISWMTITHEKTHKFTPSQTKTLFTTLYITTSDLRDERIFFYLEEWRLKVAWVLTRTRAHDSVCFCTCNPFLFLNIFLFYMYVYELAIVAWIFVLFTRCVSLLSLSFSRGKYKKRICTCNVLMLLARFNLLMRFSFFFGNFQKRNDLILLRLFCDWSLKICQPSSGVCSLNVFPYEKTWGGGYKSLSMCMYTNYV